MCGDKNYEAESNSKGTMMDEITAVKKKFEDLSKEAKEREQPKREPLADGVLPLTNEEKAELNGFSLRWRNKMKEHRTEAVKLIGDCCGQLSALRTVRHSDDKKQEAPTGLTPEEREQCVKLFYSMLEYFCGEGSGVEASVRGHRLFNEHQDTDAETMEFIKTITDYLNGKPEVVEMFDRGLEDLGKFKEGDTE